MVMQSLSGGDFPNYWARVNALCYATTTARTGGDGGDGIPTEWLREYAMIRDALVGTGAGRQIGWVGSG